jgi:dTDP-4-dehydrorhamnose reductase
LKVIITGSSGQLGHDLVRALSFTHELIPLARRELDITNAEQVWRIIQHSRPDVIIHAAAFTDVDGAELDSEKAYEVNSMGTRNVARAAQRVGAKLVYISTDYVFDGQKGESYTELDRPSPISVYGCSKLLGEQFVDMHCEQSYIVRTAWLFGSYGPNFVKKMYALACCQNQVLAAVDCIGSPTYSVDLALFIGQLIRTDKYGKYHATNQGGCSRFEFAQAIVRLAGMKDVDILPVDSSAFKLRAARPPNSTLDDRAIRSNGLPLFRDWRSALQVFMSTDRYFMNQRRGDR